MFFWVSADSKTLHFQAQFLFSCFKYFQDIQCKFSQDVLIESRLFFKGTIIIFAKGYVQVIRVLR